MWNLYEWLISALIAFGAILALVAVVLALGWLSRLTNGIVWLVIAGCALTVIVHGMR